MLLRTLRKVTVSHKVKDSKTYLHVVDDLEEGEGHAPTNDHLVDFIEETLNEQNLVSHLRTANTTEPPVACKQSQSVSCRLQCSNVHYNQYCISTKLQTMCPNVS